MSWTVLTALLMGIQIAQAAPSNTSSSSLAVAVPTSVATVSGSGAAGLPTQVALPPVQAWCPSQIFCAGQLLQSVNVAQLWTDPKTFVDKPTTKASAAVLQDFAAFNASNPTFEQILQFVDTDFKGEGLELAGGQLSNFNANPSFLKNITSPIVQGFSSAVHAYWNQLVRNTNDSALCQNGECESTLIPLNHTFVVPGGRFREQYYWDSFWIIEGLLQSELFDTVKDTLANFMDELETIGFIPNGGRIYYLNRSQPPLFTQMVGLYVNATGDTSILERALPLAESELKWWANNRSVSVTSSYTSKTYTMARYAVNNTAPRPESYLTDYNTANGPDVSYTEDQRSALYAELASGAETGWDYTARFSKAAITSEIQEQNYYLRALNIRETIPICLNSILYKNHLVLADLYGSTNKTAADAHRTAAATIREGILDLFWEPTKLAFYDYDMTTNKRNDVYTAAHFYPFWSGIIPDEVLANSTNAFGAFSSINMVLNRYNGTFPTTFLSTGLQWDAPNSWPPHNYIALQALRALPSNVTSGPRPTPQANQNTFSLIPTGQIGLKENQLPLQPIIGAGNASTSGAASDVATLNGTVANGGNATDGEGWGQTLQRELANRYVTAAFCGWYATGGSIPNLLPRRPNNELNVTQSINNTGNMFEKFSIFDVDSAGRGGEYTVQAGFGWTNGVLLWVAGTYGNILNTPVCPDPLDSVNAGHGNAGFNLSPGMGAVFGVASLLISSLIL